MKKPIKRTMLKFIVTLACLVSAYCTAQLMLTNTSGWLSSLATVGIVLVIEYCKCYYIFRLIEGEKLGSELKGWVKWTLTALASFLVLISIFASLAFFQNETERLRAIEKKKSPQYAAMLEEKANLEGEKANLLAQQRLSDELATKGYNSLIKEKDSLNATTHPTARGRLTTEANNVLSTRKEASEKEIEALQVLNVRIKNAVDLDGIEIESKRGFTRVLTTISEFLSDPETDTLVKVSTLESLFFGMISVVFEFLVIFIVYLYKRDELYAQLEEELLNSNSKSSNVANIRN